MTDPAAAAAKRGDDLPFVDVLGPVSGDIAGALEAVADGLVESIGIDILDRVAVVQLPWGFDEFTCPHCERSIPTRKQIRMTIPAKFEHLLNQCFKCPWCNFIWSPKRIEAKRIGR